MKKQHTKLSRLLITGSQGRIGRILTKVLGESYDVYGLDIRGDTDGKNFLVDIAHFESLYEVFKKIAKIEAIVHLAAEIRLDAPWYPVLQNNIIGTRNIYECARVHKIRRVVFASSNHVTGMYEGLLPTLHKKKSPKMISVDDEVRPDGFYGLSKAFGELFARLYFDLYHIESICLRIGTVIEDDDPTVDERFMKTWLSHRDLIQLVKNSLKEKVPFGIYYGVSNNKERFWDISNAERELHYQPRDDASTLIPNP